MLMLHNDAKPALAKNANLQTRSFITASISPTRTASSYAKFITR